MAEAVVFNLASKILSTVASPAFNMAYEKGVSIWEARDELAKLQVSVETIQAVLLDAEKKQDGSSSIKNWIKRVKGVLYDAEDLFDEIATENLLKQQMVEGKEKLSLSKKVHVSFSRLNPVISRNTMAKKIKAIRVSLDDISRDMAQFQFVKCLDERPMFNMGRGEDRGCFVDAKSVIGREEDKKTILKMLIDESISAKSDNPIVLAIVGIGGMGKTTLSQLIYNDEEIRNVFENRWFACISDTSNEREVLVKIFESIMRERNSKLDVGQPQTDIGQLQTKIRESTKDKKYLLVLDDVWEEDRTRWQDRMNLLSSGGTKSRIIITTRSPLVAKAVGAISHNLEGLSEDDSWSLFKRSAFANEYEYDTRLESLGREILKKCRGVPLAIRSIGSLLYLNNTVEEWEAIKGEDLPVLGRKYNDKTMSVLKLSYDYLPSHLKHCFAYCCLFPKDYVFSKRELTNHWITQGYIDPNDEESGVLHLLRRGFFQEIEKGESGEIKSCKMHDLMHDLAIYVAGEETVVPSSTSSYTSKYVRHVSFKIPYSDEPWDISTLKLNAKSLRSLLLTARHFRFAVGSVKLDQLFASSKLLRTLSLSGLRIKNISPSIGELKLMRLLDLSYNDFEELPHSIGHLVNLLSLILEGCSNLKAWPVNFHKLINLRYLDFQGCNKIRLMPMGIGKMTHLQYVSDVKIGKENGLDALAGFLERLRGKLSIEVSGDVDVDDCNWQLPASLQQLQMLNYPGMRMPGWGDYGQANNLAHLELIGCTRVKYMPTLSCLPNLRSLLLENLTELEFIEKEENVSKFFPSLEELNLRGLLNLKRWWRKVVMFAEFPRLRVLFVDDCPHLEFESFPLCSQVKILTLNNRRTMQSSTFCSSASPSPEENNAISRRTKWQLSLGSLQELDIVYCSTLKSLHVTSPHLEEMHIMSCNELLSIDLVAPQHLRDIQIQSCKGLKSIELVEAQTPTPSLWCLHISDCEELEILRASERIIFEVKQLWIYKCLKLRLQTPVLASPTALNLGGCSWSIEVAEEGDVELIEQLSWLPIQDVHIARCKLPIRFPIAQFTSLQRLEIVDTDGLEILRLDASSLLQEVYIRNCKRLTSVEVEAPISIGIFSCPRLNYLCIADPDALKKFSIEECPDLGDLYGHELVKTQPVVKSIPYGWPGITVQRASGKPVS